MSAGSRLQRISRSSSRRNSRRRNAERGTSIRNDPSADDNRRSFPIMRRSLSSYPNNRTTPGPGTRQGSFPERSSLPSTTEPRESTHLGHGSAKGRSYHSLLKSKKDIKALNKEFKFAVDCLKTMLRGFQPQWCTLISAPLADRSRDKLCTQDIKTALLYAVVYDVGYTVDLIFEDWFHCSESTKHINLQKVLLMLTTEFCNNRTTSRDLLEYISKVAELSARLYIMGDSFGPTYCTMCIFYVVIHCKLKSKKRDFDMWKELDNVAKRSINNATCPDPMAIVNYRRRAFLLNFGFRYQASNSEGVQCWRAVRVERSTQ